MSGYIVPSPQFRAFDADGLPLAGGKLYSYAGGTSTPLATYADAALSVPNANPLILSASGGGTFFIAGGTSYKFTLTDSAGVVQSGYPVDSVSLPIDANLSALSATNLTTGTLNDSRLSTKVPLRDVNEAISGVYAFTNGFKERSRTALVGEGNAVAFSAANFTATGAMTWTVASGNITNFRYAQVGKRFFLDFCIESTTVGGTAGLALQFAIPGGVVPAYRKESTCRVVNGGVAKADVGLVLATAGVGLIQIYSDLTSGVNWALGSASVFGGIDFETT